MPILVDCACGRDFRIKDELAGKKVRCPECKSILAVPEPVDGAEIEFEPEETRKAAAPAPSSKVQAAPAPIRKVQPIRLPDEYTPSRTKSDYSDEAVAKPKPKRRKSRAKKESSGWLPGISVNPSIVTGLLMMAGAVVWFFGALALGYLFVYPPIMFCLGIGAVIKGFTGRD
jgi:hypothetical protein